MVSKLKQIFQWGMQFLSRGSMLPIYSSCAHCFYKTKSGEFSGKIHVNPNFWRIAISTTHLSTPLKKCTKNRKYANVIVENETKTLFTFSLFAVSDDIEETPSLLPTFYILLTNDNGSKQIHKHTDEKLVINKLELVTCKDLIIVFWNQHDSIVYFMSKCMILCYLWIGYCPRYFL